MTHIVKEKLVAYISEKVVPLVAVGCSEKYIYSKMMECINKAPAEDVRPVVYTEWDYYSTTMMECRNCGKHVPRHRYDFCPRCGATVRRA